MSTTPDSPEDPTLWSPINGSRNKPDLDNIAKALGIFNRKDRKTLVIKKINNHLKNNLGLAKERHFQDLFVYRRDKEAECGAPKSSTEKEAEVEVKSKAAKEATGYVFCSYITS